MEISNKLIEILKLNKDKCVVSNELYKLRAHPDKFINGIGYLDIAISNPSLISYITEDRVENFKYFGEPTLDFSKLVIGYKIKTQQTFLVSDNNNTRFFINENQIARIEKNYANGEYIDLRVSIIKNHKRVFFDHCEYKHFKIPKINKEYYNFFNEESRNKRAFMARAGKVINKIFGEDKFSKADIENFVRLFFVNNNPLSHRGLQLRVVNGKDIRRYYDGRKYIDRSGSLQNSCMKHSSCQDYFGIYTDNKNVSMLILVDADDLIHGRALLWDGIDIDKIGTIKMMDRIYTSNSNDEEVFKQWAEVNNYAYKSEQTIGCNDIWYNKVYYNNCEMSIKLEYTDFNSYPYIDTLRYLTSSGLNNINGHICLDSTDGGPNNRTVWSNWEGGDIPQNESVYSGLYDSDLCESRSTYSIYLCDWIPNEEVVVLETGEIMGERSRGDDFEEDVNGKYYLMEDLIKYNRYYYHVDDCEECVYNHETYPVEFMARASNGKMVFKEDLDLYEEEINQVKEEVV